jgi:7-carboxy-7-deazaguanine synthase
MYQLNTQAVEKQDLDPNKPYEVVGVWKTIQGEGPYVGYPAVFVRLAGCNLQCPRCDTDYTSGRVQMSTHDLLAEIVKEDTGGLVVITGGEPFRQKLGPIIRELLAGDYFVQIETNGTLYDDDMPWFGALSVVCSPKTPKIHPELEDRVTSYKYVLDHRYVDEKDGLPTKSLESSGGVFRPRPSIPRHRIFLQPMEVKECPAETARNVEATVRSCMKYGYRLSLQTHKIVGVP